MAAWTSPSAAAARWSSPTRPTALEAVLAAAERVGRRWRPADATSPSEMRGGRLAGAIEARDVDIPGLPDPARRDCLRDGPAGQHAAPGRIRSARQHQPGLLRAARRARPAPARLIAVDAAVAGDSRRIAAAGVNEIGDNAVAKGPGQPPRRASCSTGNSATLVDGWSHLAYRVGRDTRSAIDGLKAQTDIVEQIDALRDSVSGVSLDEESRADDQVPARLRGQRPLLQHGGPDAVDPVLRSSGGSGRRDSCD